MVLARERRRIVASWLALTLVFAADAGATRFEFLTYHDGRAVSLSEICFLARAFDRQGVPGILASREIRCLPGDMVLELPRGGWYFYARNALGLVSPNRGQITRLSHSAPADAFKSVRVDLVPGGTLDVSAIAPGAEERVFAWGPDTRHYQAVVMMLGLEEKKVMVPADQPMIVILSRNGVPVWSGKPVTVTPGGTTRVVRTEPAPERMNVLAWIAYGKLRSNEAAPPSPSPVLEIDGRVYTPSVPLGAVRTGDFVLLQFLDVPKRPGVFRLNGGGWNATPLPFDPGSGNHLFLESPLILRGE